MEAQTNPFEQEYQRTKKRNPFEDAYAATLQPSDRPKVGHAEGLGRQALQGATMGLSEEAEALQAASGQGAGVSLQGLGMGLGRTIAEKLFGDGDTTYEQVRDASRERQEAYADEHGALSGVANVAGALPTAAVSLPGLLGRSAIAGGAAMGAASGFGTAEGDAMAQLEGTVKGAGLGGVLGGAFETLRRPLAHIGGAVMTRLNLRPRQNFGPIEGTESIARRFVRRQFERDNVTQQGAIAGLQSPGSFYHRAAQTPEVVADAGGVMTRRALGGLASLPGKTAGRAKEVLESRTAGQFGRITDGVRRVLGVADDDADRVATELVEARRAASKPLYEQAYAHGKVDDPLINKLMENPNFKRAWIKARSVARDEGVKLPKVYKKVQKVMADGKTKTVLVPEERPNVLALDYMKRELDGIIKKGLQNTGKGGLSSTQANAIRKLRNRFVDRLDEIVPAYKAARQKFSTDMAAEEALENGRLIFSRNTRLTADEVADLSDAEREMFLVGAYRAIKDRLGSIGDHRDLTKVLNNPDVRAQLRQVARTPDEFDEIMSLLGSEMNMAETAATIQGSRTAPVGAMQAEIEGISPDVFTALGSAASGSWGRAGAQAVRALFSRQSTHPLGQVAEQAGDMLLSPATPQNISRIFQPEQQAQPVVSRALGALGGAIASPALSHDPTPARMEAISMRQLGMSDADLEAQLSQRYTPEVVQFIIAATPQRVPQQ